MAKQRRTPLRPHKSQTDSESALSSGADDVSPVPRPLHSPNPTPPRRSTYFEAVAVYERAVQAIQRHSFAAARALLESVLAEYPEEKELHERVRLYLKVCARQEEARSAEPRSVDERLYAATLAINEGNYDEAIKQLHLVRDEDPDNDHAIYMLGVAHAQRGDHIAAVAHLERAMALNPENRAYARQDPDLEPIRDDEAFRAALETSTAGPEAAPRLDRRRPIRPRPPR
jgi:tetratricopeptide (TPR) repeat protein